MTRPWKLGMDLALNDVIVVMRRERRITSFEAYEGPLDLPNGTRLAISEQPDGKKWGITVLPWERFDVIEAPVPTLRIAARLTHDSEGRPVVDLLIDAPASAASALTDELRRLVQLLAPQVSGGAFAELGESSSWEQLLQQAKVDAVDLYAESGR